MPRLVRTVPVGEGVKALASGQAGLYVGIFGNGEIASRISPGLYALLTALGAGAAFYLIERHEQSGRR